jgi:hypothetical protein
VYFSHFLLHRLLPSFQSPLFLHHLIFNLLLLLSLLPLLVLLLPRYYSCYCFYYYL